MANYIDGFALPLPRNRRDEYRRVVEAIAEIWKEHGAIDYKEFIGDDLHMEGTRSFTETLEVKDDEILIFGWVEFESREKRDLANEKISADPRVALLMENAEIGFDAKRMVYAGFSPFI